VAYPCWLADTDLGDQHCDLGDGCVDFAHHHVDCRDDRLIAR
jgi:hypothetical protein